jgi:hypothetical protein
LGEQDLAAWAGDAREWLAANQGGYYDAEDVVAGVFEFTLGVRGVGLWLFDADEDRDEVEITGTAGTLRFPTLATSRCA